MMIRGIIQSVSRTLGKLARFNASGRAGETMRNRELLQNYGFASMPPAGSVALMIKRGNHIICIAAEKADLVPARTAGQEWLTALYSDPTHFVMIKESGEILVKAEKVTVEAAEINLGDEVSAAAGGGVVTGNCLCAYTGGPHPIKSGKVKARL